MFGFKSKLLKCRFELADLLTCIKSISAKVVMFGIKPKVVKFRFVLTCLLKDHLS
jgi:hypothetical protein